MKSMPPFIWSGIEEGRGSDLLVSCHLVPRVSNYLPFATPFLVLITILVRMSKRRLISEKVIRQIG